VHWCKDFGDIVDCCSAWLICLRLLYLRLLFFEDWRVLGGGKKERKKV
jgi:hypothetical protein